MKQILFSLLLVFLISMTGKQTGIILSGIVTDNFAVLHWENQTSFVIKSYTIRKKVNAGNLKNAFITVAVLDASTMDFSVPMTNGKNTFLIAGLSVEGHGIPSNELSLNH